MICWLSQWVTDINLTFYAIRACLQHTERALVAHLDEAAQRQFKHHAALVRHKVAHLLEQEEQGSVVVAVTRVLRFWKTGKEILSQVRSKQSCSLMIQNGL